MTVTGGCQCGAVRFRVEGGLGEASICHCRMCQKATGGLFGPYVGVAELAWTRGAPRRFQSSNKVWRGFCEACGTPLTWEYVGGLTSVMIGTLDDPSAARITLQLGSPSKLAAVDALAALPTHEPTEPRAAAHLASIVSLQHPDRDT
ncbi:GFA family protein [Phenylobacterium sp. SCN 70-31]|uniref:GFA family protein n=1 Tax=Phenylobacterium sp. SCN 70-31 TaxID=1660129 RepID=UPI00086F8995|nr:GFA family protein [Phenylobacterium sp. SCN 70-31]ODT89303.1 MAG: aldehyde-activating protein [Phenylobacterium sp. SCN 70-31]